MFSGGADEFVAIIVVSLLTLGHATCTHVRDCKYPSCRPSGCYCDGEPFSALNGVCGLKVVFGTSYDQFVLTNSGKIGNNGACNLGAALGTIQSLQYLSLALEENGISSFGAMCLAKGIGKLTSLDRLELNLDSNPIGASGSHVIGEALGRLPKLTNLTLNMIGPTDDELPKLGSEGARMLCAGLRRSTKFESLNMELGFNDIGDQGAIEIGRLLTSLTSLSSLSIDFFDNRIGPLGIMAIGSGLQALTNLSHIKLVLEQVNLTNTDMAAFGAHLSALKGLRSFSLRLWADSVTNANFHSWLAKLPNLESFSISFESAMISNTFISDLGIALGALPSLSFIDVDMARNDGQLDLLQDSDGSWDQRSVCELAKMFELLTKIRTLKISFWGVGSSPNEQVTRCLCALWTSFSKMVSLSVVEIRTHDAHIGASGSHCLADALMELNWLTSLVLELDRKSLIGNEGAKALGSSLGTMANLTSLSLNLECGTDANDLAAIGLADGMRALASLRDLKFHLDTDAMSDITYIGMHAIVVALGNLINLQTLDIKMYCDAGPNPPVKGLGNLRKLTRLKYFGCLSLQGFGEQLRSLTHVTKMEFHVGTTSTESMIAIQEFGGGLGAMTSLDVLSLELKDVGVAFAQAVGVGLGNLRELRALELKIEANPEEGISAVGAADLGAGLGNLSKLRSLNINTGGFDPRGLGGGIMHLHKLRQLEADFTGCKIHTGAANGLVQSIAMLKKLYVLDLDLSDNRIGYGFRFLDEGRDLMELTNVVLDLQFNRIGDEGLRRVGIDIGSLPNLMAMSLNVGDNEIGDDGINGLAQGMVKSTNLCSVTVHYGDNHISDAGVCSLAVTLKKFDVGAAREVLMRASSDDLDAGMQGNACIQTMLKDLSLSSLHDEDITATTTNVPTILSTAGLEYLKSTAPMAIVSDGGNATTTVHGGVGPSLKHVDGERLHEIWVNYKLAFLIFIATIFCFLCHFWRRRSQRIAALKMSSARLTDREMNDLEDADIFVAMPSTPRDVR